MIRHRHIHNRKGQTLIEVLIALVVFVVGIFAVVRMFPGGFTALQQGESIAAADRLAQAELDRLQSMSQNLPAGILPVADTFTDNPSDPDVAAGFRRVEGESTVIPAPADNDESRYMVAFGPVDSSKPVTVYSSPMTRVAYPTDGSTPKTALYKNGEYSIDYVNGIMWVHPQNYDRSYRVSYSYWIQNGSNMDSIALPGTVATVPAATSSISLPGSGLSNFKGIVVGSDKVSRAFVQLNQSDAWSGTDPYEFKLADANLGVLYFNPTGYSYKEGSSWARPLSAYIDYTILDLQIIREDRKVPDGAASSSDARLNIRLSLPRIKEKGVTAEFGNTIYAGVGAASALAHSVIAVDMGSGAQYNDSSLVNSEKVFTVDYKNGVLKFNRAFSGHSFRIFYRAEGDWMIEVSKPYNVFTLVKSTEDMDSYPRLYNSCYLTSVFDGFVEGALLFSRCYAGDSVAVDYTYQVNGIDYSVTGDVFVISKRTSIDTCNSKLVFINIASKLSGMGQSRLHQIWGNDTEIDNLKVSRVYGVSAGTRVMWRNGGRGPFAGRWKTTELQTYLPRPGK